LQLDKEEFRRLKLTLDAPLSRLLWRLTRDAFLVEDLKQETFERLFRALAGTQIDSIRDYAYGIAINVHKEWLRKRALEPPLLQWNQGEPGKYDKPDDRQDVLAKLIASEEFTRVMGVIMRMPPQQRLVITYLLIYQYMPQEVAQQMGISVATVHKHTLAAVRRFGRALERAADRPGLVKLFRKTPRKGKPNENDE
jgi:RNA polymerase sigma-70 factor (ECF subfamily)